MTDIDCNHDMRTYHGQRVTLSTSDRDTMRERRNTGRTRLTNGLVSDGHPLPCEQETQGSYAMHTMHQDENNDYDIDDGAYFREEDLRDGNQALAPEEARQRIATALTDQRFNRTAEVKNNCVRQYYSEGFHIDIPVYRTIVTGTEEHPAQRHELASGSDWTESDARGVTFWYRNQRSDYKEAYPEDGGTQFARIVRLTKQFARSREAWKPKTTSGICVTRLVADHFVYRKDRLDAALRETWQAIDYSLADTTRIEHPVYEGRPLAEEGDTEVRFFADKLDTALKTLIGLDNADCTQDDARSIWDEVFDTDFFGSRPSSVDDGNGGGGGGEKNEDGQPISVIAPAITTVRDGPDRFG